MLFVSDCRRLVALRDLERNVREREAYAEEVCAAPPPRCLLALRLLSQYWSMGRSFSMPPPLDAAARLVRWQPLAAGAPCKRFISTCCRAAPGPSDLQGHAWMCFCGVCLSSEV